MRQCAIKILESIILFQRFLTGSNGRYIYHALVFFFTSATIFYDKRYTYSQRAQKYLFRSLRFVQHLKYN